ncbi:unnamed protein product [Protopolystoma xenopodis]|uniref:Uncharacterized protein n=1 Tax=Protopolystoma xenopodis TaxID=117903 RepID=A0A448WI31_9PLAT|nr:unnamed protein product [Protopolystoma xenopodis]
MPSLGLGDDWLHAASSSGVRRWGRCRRRPLPASASLGLAGDTANRCSAVTSARQKHRLPFEGTTKRPCDIANPAAGRRET